MISVGKLVKAEQTLADLVHEFESLAEKYHRAEEALKAGQSLDVHRRDVDSMCSISAGMCLLAAVERGFIRSADSAVWDLFDARTNRINNHIRVYSRLQDQWKELADPSSPRLEPLGYGDYLSADGIAAYYSATESPIPAEPIDLDALRRKAESHLQEITQLKAKLELDSDLDLTSDEGQSLLMWTWTAFVRLELVPNHVSEFRPDWQERLLPPDFFAVNGVKDSGQRNGARSLFEKVQGETKEDRHRYCVIARANIYATACRVIVKLLHAAIDRRLAEIGRPQMSEQGGKADARFSWNVDGDSFVIRFDGERGKFLKQWVGFQRYRQLLQSRDGRVSMAKLYGSNSDQRVTNDLARSTDLSVDENGLKAIDQQRDELVAKLDEARKSGDLDAVAECEADIKQIDDWLKKNTRLKKQPDGTRRRVPKNISDPFASMRSTIWDSLDEARKRMIGGGMPKLAQHLEPGIVGSEGGDFTYSKSAAVPWVFE